MAQKFTLQNWIDEMGGPKVAKLLDVDPSTVRHWRCRYGLPRSHQMLAIKRMTKGKLTCDAMIEDFYKEGVR